MFQTNRFTPAFAGPKWVATACPFASVMTIFTGVSSPAFFSSGVAFSSSFR